MTIYEFVKEVSGLKNHEAIHRLCADVKTYMIKNKIEKLDENVVKNTMKYRKKVGG